MKNKKIAVVMGGPSSEREVSLRTGDAIYQALLSKGYNVIKIDLDAKSFHQQLQENGVQVVFNAVHGLYGEDGCMQGLLDMLGIPYTGSSLTASAIAMDKIISKRLFLSSDIKTPNFMIISKKTLDECCQEVLGKFTLPVVVKPPAQGSSVGVEIVKTTSELEHALKVAFDYSDELLIEEFISGRELTCAVAHIDGSAQVLPVIEIAPYSGVYDYHSKYTVGATNYIVPANITNEQTKAVQEMTKQAFNIMGCKGVARADFMLSENGTAYMLEVNTVPGMTQTSLVPKAAAAISLSFADLCEKILLSVDVK